MKKSNYITLALSILLIILIVLVKYDILAFFDAKMYQICTIFMNPTLTQIFKVITFLGSTLFIVLASIFLLFVLLFRDKKRRGVEYLVLLLLAMGMSTILKLIVRRPRPDILPLVIEKTFSFPSGHTIAITTLVGFLIFLLWKEEGKMHSKSKWIITIFLSLIALAVMYSRIYLGAHFFSDILGGIICALLALNITIPLHSTTRKNL